MLEEFYADSPERLKASLYGLTLTVKKRYRTGLRKELAMFGWWIILSAQTPEERNMDGDHKAKNLATWETGVQGRRLVENRTAKEHSLKGGYPNRYTALARNLLPLFQDGPPLSSGINIHAYDEAAGEDRLVRGDTNWNVPLHPDQIAACPPWKLLTLEVWDQS